MSSDWAAKAKQLDNDLAVLAYSGDPTARLAAIATALREAARVPEGCVRVGDVQTLYRGHLPYTKDRVLIVPGIHPEHAWNTDQWHNHAQVVQRPDGRWGAYFGDQWRFIEDCYSTREAAEAATSAAARGEKCSECGIYPPDHPSKTCCGCDAYREHQQ